MPSVARVGVANGRVYDPLTAQFFSPDPFIQAPGNWRNYNRYGYCMNNPTKYTDPSGYIMAQKDYVWFDSNASNWMSAGSGGGGGSSTLAVWDAQHRGSISYDEATQKYEYANGDEAMTADAMYQLYNNTKPENKHYVDVSLLRSANESINSFNYSIGGVDASNSDHDINLLSKNLNSYQQNGLKIIFGKFLDDLSRGGVQMSIEYTGDVDMSKAHWQQTVTTNWPLDGREFNPTSRQNGEMTTYPDNSLSGPNSLDYYSQSKMNENIINGGYTVTFTDAPRRYLYNRASTYWSASLTLYNDTRPVFTINYGFTLGFSSIQPIYFNYQFNPQ